MSDFQNMVHDFNEVHDRRGTYCTQWDYIQDRFGRPGIIPFSISDTDFTAPAPVVERLVEVASSGLYGYTRWAHDDWRGAIAQWHERRFGLAMVPEWIVHSPSVMYSVSLLVRLLTRPGDSIVAFDPMYDSFPGVIENNGRQLVRCSLHHVDQDPYYQFDKDELDRCASSCTALLLCSPHNPTGRVWSESELASIIEVCRKYHLWLISDEIHMDIVLGKRPHRPALSQLAAYDRIIEVSSATKTFNTPGLQGSYAIVPQDEVRAAFLSHTRQADFLNSAAQMGMYALMEAYIRCDYYVDQLCEHTRKNMMYLADRLQAVDPRIRMSVPDGTYLAWIEVAGLGVSSDELQKALVDIGGVGIMCGETYGPGGEGFLRMCLGCPQSKVSAGVAGIEAALHALNG